MLLAYLLLLTGLTISAVAIYYSVVGLAAIFSAAVIPIIIMGGALEVAKLVCASWLKANWERIPRLMKIYMTTAVVILMLITSMGIFGFLSKAHNDQNLVSGDVQSKIAIYDEKIKTAKENIDANRKALKQMDEAVDQVMGRSSDEKGADKAVAIRRGQQKERARLLAEITAEQKTISTLSEERAPIAAEVRKVEAEVGPIKYIAKFIYGDEGANENMLEKAVTWIIITIVIVFDPLAVIMLLGAQMTFGWAKEQKAEGDSPERSEAVIDESETTVTEPEPEERIEVEEEPTEQIIPSFLLKKEPQLRVDPHPNGWMFPKHVDLRKYQEVPDIKYQILEDVDEEDEDSTSKYKILPELQQELDKPAPVIKKIGDGEYVNVDGVTYHWKASPVAVNPPEVATPPSVNAMDERPGDYLPTEEKMFVQNEEQQESNKWLGIHTTTEETYLDTAEEKLKGKDGK